MSSVKLGNLPFARAFAFGALLAATQAAAQGYVGASLGQSDVERRITNGLITSGPVDSKDTAWKLFGGYLFYPNLGLEVAYVNLGEVTYSGDFFGAAVSGGKVETSGFNVAAIGVLPLTESFAVFGKFGFFAWEVEASDTTAGIGAFTAQADGTNASFGLGLSYNFTPNLGVRAEWERFRVELFDQADADLISIGLLWRF